MAVYAVAGAGRGAYAKALAAGVVDTVRFDDRDVDLVEVYSDGAAAVYVTVDGTAPTVRGAVTFELPAGGPVAREIRVPGRSAPTVVKLISAGAVGYSVSEASS